MMVLSIMGLALSHLLRLIIHWQRWAQLRLATRIPRILTASLLLGTFAALLKTLTGLAAWQTADLTIGAPSLSPLLVIIVQALNWTFLFILWSALYFGVLAVRDRRSAELRQSELARALQASELRLLKSQLNPHFLFNALNTVRALIAEEPTRAQSAVTQLARTLRYTLSSGQDELVTFEQELAIVEDYLELEALRLGERLRVELDIAPQACGTRIPVMLLQTLVENAIKHGIAELPDGGVLRICAGVAQGALVLEVKNTRPERPMPGASEGIGIANAQKRLRLIFGPEAVLDLDLSQPAWARARVRLPLTL
jgi:LytS/YehU family sensor histidine kinase